MSKTKVLLAEDSPMVLDFFRGMLEESGFEVIAALDGLDAVGKFFQFIPDVVVSDVEMPVMTGYHFCRLLKSEAETRNVPFILLTALTEGRFEYWGKEIGADRYIRKDEGGEDLPGAIRELAAQNRFDPNSVRKLGERYANPFHILNQVNRMLDAKLMEMTLIQKFASLAFENISLIDLARRQMETLLKIVSVEALVAVILNTEEIHIFIHAGQPIGADFTVEFQDFCYRFLQDKSTIDLGKSRIEPECFADLDESDQPFQAERVEIIFRRLTDEVQMALFLLPPADVPIQKGTQNLLETLTDYISITLGQTFAQEKIKSLSVIDSLTRLYNRGHYMSLLQAEYRRSIRHNLNLSVIFMDLDNFKSINDTYGHLCGDVVLKSLAETILGSIRTSDVAGRYGGEEFVVYLPETNLDNAFMTAERLRKTWESKTIQISKTQHARITVSMGVASVAEVDPGKGIEGMLELADQKLYKAKLSGKNRVIR